MIKRILIITALLLTGLALAAEPFDERLAAFSEKEDAASANAFFQTLLDEEFLDEPLVFGPDTPLDRLREQVWYWAGEYFYDRAEYQQSKEFTLKAMPLITDETEKADALSLLSLTNVRLGNYDDALMYAKECYALDDANGDPDRISSSLNTIAGICLAANRPQEGESYILKALDVVKKTGNTAREAVLEGMASEIYHAMGDDAQALEHIDKACRLDEGTPRAIIRQTQKASVLLGLHRWSEAEEILGGVLPVLRASPDRHSLGIACNKMGMALLSQDRDEEAARYYSEAAEIFSEMGDIYNEVHARRGLYEALWTLDPDEAKRNLDRFDYLKDSLYSISSAEMLAKYNAEFGADELRAESRAERQGRRLATLLVVILAILCTVIALVMGARHRRQARINRQLSADIEDLREKYRRLELLPAAEEKAMNEADRLFLERVVGAANDLIAEGSIDATTLSSRLGLSPFQFRQRLTDLTGETPQAFVQTLRMRRAQYLLEKHHELNISEIAILCAYSDTPNFTRAFKAKFGMTPTQYQEQLKAASAR